MDFVTDIGHGPFHPFQAFEYERFEGGPVGREMTIEFCKKAIEICDEFWMFGVSDGTLQELLHAKRLGKPTKLLLNEFDPNWRDAHEALKTKYKQLNNLIQ